MLSRVLIVWTAALAATSIGCRKPMEAFTSTEYKFKARFPGKPKHQSQAGPLGLTMTMFIVETPNQWAYGVGVLDLPIPDDEPAALIQNRLEGGVQGSVFNMGATLQSSRSL